MPLLLDAYNVLHVTGVLPPDLAGIDLEELADLIAGSRHRHEPAILVCDGPARHHRVSHPSVHVRFAGPGKTADDLIARLIRRSTSPRRMTVITSDREIAQAVRRRRATVIESERFLQMLAEDHAVIRPQSPHRGHGPSRHLVDRRQVDAWLRLFDLEPEMHAITSTTTTSGSAGHPPPKGRPPSSTDRKTPTAPRRRGRSALDAECLADIDPATIDELDTAALLDTTTKPMDDDVDGG
jgi:predicted RNA-binding protein with PIN domain